MTNNTDKLEQQIQQTLEESAQDLDAATRSRLTQARQQALTQLEHSPAPSSGWLAPAGMLATAATALLVINLNTGTSVQDPAPLDDLDLITIAEDLDFYEELDFYEWLEQHELPG